MRFFWLLCVLAAQRAPAECPHGMLTPAQARIRYQELQEQADKLFQAGEFASWPWTYADYREPDVRAFLKEVREWYRGKIRASPRPS